jgi:hypothetical protein
MNYLIKIKEELLQTDRTELILRLSAIMFLLHGHTNWALDIPIRIMCSLMLISTGLLKSRLLWGCLFIIFFFTNAGQWYIIDNHKYLMTYWCLACCLAVFSEKSLKLLQINARWLIGLTFLFATLWKLFTLEYADGSFLHFTMLTDSRMKVPAMLGGTVSLDALDKNYELFSFFRHFPDPAKKAQLIGGATSGGFALGWSYLTLLVEGLLAVVFLFNIKFFRKFRNYLLILFVLGTYYLLPVIGFGFLLTILGLSQLDVKERPALFFAYMITLALIQLTIVPIDRMIISILH